MRVLALFLFVTAIAFAQRRLEHVWGRISAMTKSGFEVDQNFNADPQSGYRRGKRQITFKIPKRSLKRAPAKTCGLAEPWTFSDLRQRARAFKLRASSFTRAALYECLLVRE